MRNPLAIAAIVATLVVAVLVIGRIRTVSQNPAATPSQKYLAQIASIERQRTLLTKQELAEAIAGNRSASNGSQWENLKTTVSGTTPPRECALFHERYASLIEISANSSAELHQGMKHMRGTSPDRDNGRAFASSMASLGTSMGLEAAEEAADGTLADLCRDLGIPKPFMISSNGP
jgi:hypothetical protein